MTVVFLSWAFPPLKYPRAIQVSRLVKHLNVPVHVVCGDESGIKDESIFSARGSQGLTVTRIRRPDWRRYADWLQLKVAPAALKLPDPYRAWARTAARHVLQYHSFGPGDVLVTFGQPMSDHLAGRTIKARTGVPWIAHFSDPWVDNPFILRTGFLLRINADMERSVVEQADLVLFTSDETLDLVMGKYPIVLRTKARVLPHAFDASLYPQRAPSSGPLVLRHIGNFYGNRSAEPLFRALAELLRHAPGALNGVRVELIGSMPGNGTSSAPLTALPNGLVTLTAPVTYDRSLALMIEADALLVLDAPAEASVFLPSKLIDYIGARRPIFGITPPGVSASLIRELGGEVADPGDAHAIADGLSRVIRSLRRGEFRDSWGDESVRARYSASVVARRMEDLIAEVKPGN